MARRIDFPTALALWGARIDGEAEYSFVFSVRAATPKDRPALKEQRIDGILYREVPDPRRRDEVWDGNQKHVSIGPTEKQKQQLSNRFTDSWDDSIAPAYTLEEIAALLPEADRAALTLDADPNQVAATLLQNWAKNRP